MSAKSPNHLDLMMLADGELDAATARRIEASLGADDRAALDGLRELRDAVRGHLELAADAAEPKLDALWDRLAPELGAAPAAVERPGLWQRFNGWLDDHRSNLLTGLATAGAVAAVMLYWRPTTQVIERQVLVTAPAPDAGAIRLASTPPAIESLDVPSGTGTVFTIQDEDGETAVIWISPSDTVEGL